jgi:hypothetical protein
MIPRIFMVVEMCALCAAPLSAAGTRMFVSAGVEGSSEFYEGEPPQRAYCLKLVIDAPPSIRKHVPIELAFGYTGPYPEREWHPAVYDAIADWQPSRYTYWSPHYRISESV